MSHGGQDSLCLQCRWRNRSDQGHYYYSLHTFFNTNNWLLFWELSYLPTCPIFFIRAWGKKKKFRLRQSSATEQCCRFVGASSVCNTWPPRQLNPRCGVVGGWGPGGVPAAGAKSSQADSHREHSPAAPPSPKEANYTEKQRAAASHLQPEGTESE